MTVKDSTTDTVSTIKPTGRDMFERRSLKDDIFSEIVGLELRDVPCRFLYAADNVMTVLDERTLEEYTFPADLAKSEVQSLLEGKTKLTDRLLRLRWYSGQVENGTG